MLNFPKLLFLGTFIFAAQVRAEPNSLTKLCIKDLKKFPGVSDRKSLDRACASVQQVKACKSSRGRPIYHFDKQSQEPDSKKILVFSLIHGDETAAGTVGRYWMERLESLAPRNSWRIIPILNPDGVKDNTRTNANRIDLNRNFPTKDWGTNALKDWKRLSKSDPRRFPGKRAASEPETKCALEHLNGYQPDFVVSVHTPLRVLDYDGPKVQPPPKYDYLPWKSLGSFPGSLGRYMWLERQTPVLTMELTEKVPMNLAPFEKLQDIIGALVKFEIPSGGDEANETEDSSADNNEKYPPIAQEH